MLQKQIRRIIVIMITITTLFFTLCFVSCKLNANNGIIEPVQTQLSTPGGLRIENGNLCWNPVVRVITIL